jgi:hypothetical protein
MDTTDNGNSGQNPPWNSNGLPKPNSQPRVSAVIKNLIAELGLRFPATSQTDGTAHASRLALLAMDLRDMPPHILKQTIERYVLIPGRNFLPKAAELVEIGRSIVDESKEGIGNPHNVPDYVEWFNRKFTFAEARIVTSKPDDDGKTVDSVDIVPRHASTKPFAKPLTDDEIRKMPPWIISMGITIGDLDADHCARIRRVA